MMIDPSGFLGLLYSLSKEWTEASEVPIGMQDAEHEPALQKAKADGHQVGWVRKINLRSMYQDGWKPLTDRDKLGRPTFFVDPKRELLLMYKKSDK